ncbi:RecX family protein [Candidatus Chrysopegis kryptomonas]|uniref:Regulatory protein RecX n=1 Tax=Candidatus Chryseopegocella kryptomonas TaxID=1633643 RepID=A0A0P1MSW1_9BACT|nr:RecX family protein [Candidatus Chrysopegis kryptomonas]
MISKAVEDIKRYGFINDLEYARNFVLNKSKSKSLGKVALKQALLLKGIPLETIEQVIAERENLIDETEVAFELAQKKLKLLKSSKKKKRSESELKRKIYEFLTRRGFTWETINHVIGKIFDDSELYI